MNMWPKTPAADDRAFDLVARSKIEIQRPVAVVWPCFLDMSGWMKGSTFRNIEGISGEEGELRLVTPENQNQPYASFYIRTVRATRWERFTTKVTPKDGDDYFGFADFSFTGDGHSTIITNDIYLQLRVPAMNDAEFRKFVIDQNEFSANSSATELGQLKKIVESQM